MFEIPGRIHLHQTIFRGWSRLPPPMGTSCHQESSDAPSSRWRPSLGPLTALGGHDFASLHIPPGAKGFFHSFTFLFGGLVFLSFRFYTKWFFEIFFCPFFLSFLSVPGFLHKMAIHKCRRHGCLKLFAGILEALSLCQMLKPFIYYLTLEMRARRRVSYIDESSSTETSDSFLF